MTDDPLRRGASATSLRSAIEAVRPARGRARQFWPVFSTSHVPMVVVDNDRRYVAANVAARLVVRLSLGEFLTRTIDDLTPPHMRSRLHEGWDRLVRDGAAVASYDIFFPDGGDLQIVYFGLANVLPALHLIAFVPANWPRDELSVGEEPGEQPSRRPLSAREREVLSLVATGAGMDQIAGELVISVATVRTHTRNALRKLGARNRAHAIALALRQGIIDAPGSSLEPSMTS